MVNQSTRKKPQNIHGILLLDKPLGLSSNQALQQVKRIINAKKAGHTGSLDPLATGMLPLCFGEATKFSQFLLDADKYYRVIAKLGVQTTTGDTEGEIVATKPIPAISEQQLEKVLDKFRGRISQIPSMYSALKHQGQPLYQLARQGIVVERAAREIKIYHLELLERDNDSLTLAVHCSKGTYIRTLVEDIGLAMGCVAHVSYLRRTAVTPYHEEQMVTMPSSDEQTATELSSQLLPIDSSLKHLPQITLTQALQFYIARGEAVMISKLSHSGYVRLIAESGKFLGVGEVLENGKIAPRRLINFSNNA